jgi:hypothetical protein
LTLITEPLGMDDRLEHCRKVQIERRSSPHIQTLDHEKPVATTRQGYEELGHPPRPILDAIREKCWDCSGGSFAEIKLCRSLACALYPFRLGKNPWRAEQTPEQRAAAGARLHARNRPNPLGGNAGDELAATYPSPSPSEGKIGADSLADVES